MPRHIKTEQPTPARKRRKKTAPKKPRTGSDRKPVTKPKGGYAHKAEAGNRLPTREELEQVDLSGNYETGKTPEIVMYGRRLQVLSLMVKGEPTFNIIEFCQQAFQMSETQTRYIIHDIRTKWRGDMDEQIVFARAEAIMRLRRDLSQMRNVLKPDWASINRHEKLLAKIEGTEQPVKLNVLDGNKAARDAMAAIVGNLSDEDIETFVTLGIEVEEAASKLLPEHQAAE